MTTDQHNGAGHAPRRRGSRRTLPMPPVDTPEHRAIIEHSIEAYADPVCRFRLSPRESRETAEGLREHAQRYGLAVPHYLQSWGLGGGSQVTKDCPDVGTPEGVDEGA